ncbi:2-phosphoglycolate phosphatase [Basidiobolus meristosporus CBS 931.73]|uniref:4-nitrophenylphosphatase n=1 Tax=Basidiobolus meristosporus CBS 931.73 TaxID=1314790 RepID=A0A1Y1X9D9_9FUNG|nr:2-phosphoglycolate phosphatase [Basidiobolus meristosporus CBS 931.73]|eukprot:ORX82355.1 2-phosphoglycolate phosphatase [Basidiobolus meristosporus CBS 931.73]
MANKLSTKLEVEEFLASIDTFLVDCDGVLWKGSEVIDGIRETLDYIRGLGKRILFVTNNSIKSRRQYLSKFNSLGIKSSEEEIFGSSYATAYYLKHILHFPDNKKVYGVGADGLREELEQEGIQVCGIGEDNEAITFDGLKTIQPDDTIGAVVMGMDINVNYRKYAKAFTYLHHNTECHFIATNEDILDPIAGTVFPAAGAFLSPLTIALDRKPIVMGKPEKPMIDCIVKKYHLDKSRTCMVGDRLNTDILFGINGGLKTLLVLTGITQESELASEQAIRPDHYADALSSLYYLTR